MRMIKMESKPNCIVHVGEPEYPVKSELGPSQATSRVRKLSTTAWAGALETLLIALTIGFGFSIEKEFSRSIVAVATHALFSTVTTGFVFWNKSLPTRRSVLNAVKLWISNVLFLTKPLSFWSTREKGASYGEKRAELCNLETKLKASYTRLLVSFFTVIPACTVQYYYLLQAGDRIYYRNLYAIDVLRIATIATGCFSTAACVYEYDELTIEYELESEIEPTSSSVEFRTGFWRYFMCICQRVTFTTYLIFISPYFALTYIISNFTSNYVILKHMPQIENSYVNAPQGTHSTQSFWTFRIINIISGVGTRLNLNLMYHYSTLWSNPLPSFPLWVVFGCHIFQLQFIALLLLIPVLISFGSAITYKFILCFFWGTVLWDTVIDLLSFPFGGSAFVMEWKHNFEAVLIEPFLDSVTVK